MLDHDGCVRIHDVMQSGVLSWRSFGGVCTHRAMCLRDSTLVARASSVKKVLLVGVEVQAFDLLV